MAEHTTTFLEAPDFDVWIEVDGQKAPVYGQEAFDGKKTSGYIESKAGSQFTVHYKFKHRKRPATDLMVRTYVDGSHVQAYYYQPNNTLFDSTRESRVGTVIGLRTGDSEVAPLLFKKIALTDDLAKATSTENFIKRVGTIEVKVGRVRYVKLVEFQPSESLGGKMVHERVKKATLSHQTSLAAPIKQVYGTQVTTEPYDPNEIHFLEFEFRYLSRDLLELKGLVEPEPVPEESLQARIDRLERENEELRRQNLKRVKEEDGEGRAVKKERVASGSGGGEGGAKKKGKMEVITIDSDSDDD